MSRRALIHAAIGGAVTFAVFIALGTTVELTNHSVTVSHQPAVGASASVQPDEPEGPGTAATKLEKLKCFRCHNIERYRSGDDFSHDAHEEVGHCHMCHAFEGHFQATIRRQTCEGCH